MITSIVKGGREKKKKVLLRRKIVGLDVSILNISQ